jgi:hypothetical protein
MKCTIFFFKSLNSVVFVLAKTVSTSLKQKNAPGEVMESLNQEQVRTLISRFYIQNYHAGIVFTFKLFSTMEIQKFLIYRVIQRYEEGSDAKSGAGRPTQKLPPKQARQLVPESTGRVGVSMHKLASKYGISPRYARKTLAKNGVTYRKRQPCPRYSPG